MASDIQFQVMWNRLLAVVEEQAQTLVRTAFSTPAREAGDISAGVFDVRGRMVAQAVTGTPGHVNTMAAAVPHFLAAYPLETMREGDVFVTNDPWKGTGHLSDFTVVTPTFRNGRAVAIFACTTHVVDIGGLGQSPDGRQVYHEGLWVPICKMFSRGEANDTFFAILRQNVREPVQVEGDMYALAACNEIGAKRLVEMMHEHSLDDLSPLADYVIERSREAMIASLAALPKGSAAYELTMDGYDKPIKLSARLSITDTEVVVDFAGTSEISEYGINCPKNYTDAYTAFGVKCIVGPTIPNNHGSLSSIRVEAPEGCIVNAKPPSPVMARAIIGHMLPDVAFGCLHQLVPGRVPAARGRALRRALRAARAQPLSMSRASTAAASARVRRSMAFLPRRFRAACVWCRSRSPRRSRPWWCGARNTGRTPVGLGVFAAGLGRSWRSAAGRMSHSRFSPPSTAPSSPRAVARAGATARWAA